MPAHRFLTPAFPGYESVPARLIADISMLPCDLHVWRGPRPALYATRGGDPGKVVARAERGLPFLIRETDADLLRGALAASLPTVLANQRISPTERSKTAYLIAAKLLAPLFVGEEVLDHHGFATAHRAMESFALGLLEDEEMIWAMVGTMLRCPGSHAHAINTAVYGIALARSVPAPAHAGATPTPPPALVPARMHGLRWATEQPRLRTGSPHIRPAATRGPSR